MMFKYTLHTLQKTEKILQDLGYVIRYEKGNFQTGSCVLEKQKMVVVNKFLTIEGKINALIDIILQGELNRDGLSDESQIFLKQILASLKKNEASAHSLFEYIS